jgi:23S rRNA pseudouridine1911/1915/1917 synthase
MPSSANRPENGGISFRVPEEAQGWRLDKALGLLLASPSPEQEAARPDLFALADLGLRARRRLCDRSLVLVNGKPGIPGLKLRAGQEIIILPDPEGAALPEDAPSLVYKDGGIAALYKPAGMHTAALAGSLSPSLENLLGDLLPSEGEGYASRLLNRLDAPTSGLVLASCTDDGERRWYRAERIGNTDKLYLALIEGQPLYDFKIPESGFLIVFHALACAGQRHAALLDQMINQLHRFNIFLTVLAYPPPSLLRSELRKLLLPKTQQRFVDIEHSGNLADGVI